MRKYLQVLAVTGFLFVIRWLSCKNSQHPQISYEYRRKLPPSSADSPLAALWLTAGLIPLTWGSTSASDPPAGHREHDVSTGTAQLPRRRV
jgi:hypothetical protein